MWLKIFQWTKTYSTTFVLKKKLWNLKKENHKGNLIILIKYKKPLKYSGMTGKEEKTHGSSPKNCIESMQLCMKENNWKIEK